MSDIVLERDKDNAAPQAPRSSVARRVFHYALAFSVPLGLALGWEFAVRAGWSNGRLMPPPSRILDAFADLAASGELKLHIIATLLRVLSGFALGAVTGAVIGALAGVSDIARRTLDPSLQALRSVPSIAWVPLFLLWLGIFC